MSITIKSAPKVSIKRVCPYCKYPYIGTYVGCYQKCSCNNPPLTEGRVRGSIKGNIGEVPREPLPPPCRIVKEDIGEELCGPIQDLRIYDSELNKEEIIYLSKKREDTWSWYPFGAGFCVGTLVWSFLLILSKGGL